MRPEMPYLAAGAVSIIGGVARDKAFPAHGLNAIIGTIVLVIAASATTGTKIAPLVRAIGLVLLMSALFAATRSYNKKAKKA